MTTIPCNFPDLSPKLTDYYFNFSAPMRDFESEKNIFKLFCECHVTKRNNSVNTQITCMIPAHYRFRRFSAKTKLHKTQQQFWFTMESLWNYCDGTIFGLLAYVRFCSVAQSLFIFRSFQTVVVYYCCYCSLYELRPVNIGKKNPFLSTNEALTL